MSFIIELLLLLVQNIYIYIKFICVYVRV